MKKLLTTILVISMLFGLAMPAGAAYGEHEHVLMDMANAACHYSECTICYELFNVGDHTFENGVCTVCGHDDLTPPAGAGDHKHTLMHMANAACHYSECTICYELFNVGDHTFENGACTVCGHDDPNPSEEEIRGEGAHEHILMNMANMVSHYEECQVCFELFNVGDHTFENGKCSFCGHPEYQNPFNDVSSSTWYYNDVAEAVSKGLINGKSATEFKPNDNLTYAEAIKLAACMHQKCTTGEVTLEVGDPWYSTYVDYCKENGIIRTDYPYTDFATRVGYIYIFACALPEEAYEVINDIPDGAIADVPADAPYADAVYKLYRAGIVTGVDSLHNCNPTANIQRCEVAVIVNRMMNKSARVRFDMNIPEYSEGNAYDGEVEHVGTTTVVLPGGDIVYVDISDYVYVDETELLITRQPEGLEADSYGGKAELYVGVEYGRAPYTYEWYYKIRRDTVVIENGDYVKDAASEALVLSVEPGNTLLGETICCKITDAAGTTVTTKPVKVYGPLAVPVEEVSIIEATQEYLVIGRISDGVLRVGDRVSAESSNGKITSFGVVKDIQMFGKSLDEACKGDRVGIVISLTDGVMPQIGGTVIMYRDSHVLDLSDIVN